MSTAKALSKQEQEKLKDLVEEGLSLEEIVASLSTLRGTSIPQETIEAALKKHHFQPEDDTDDAEAPN